MKVCPRVVVFISEYVCDIPGISHPARACLYPPQSSPHDNKQDAPYCWETCESCCSDEELTEFSLSTQPLIVQKTNPIFISV